MKNSQILITILIFFNMVDVSLAVTIWSEDFSSYSDNTGYIGSESGAVVNGDYPGSVSKWSLDVSAATLNASSDWFMVNDVSGNLFETRDSDGECIWTSESITISGHTGVGIQVTVTESGSHEASDYVKLYYKIDGGSETQFETNGSNVDDFTSVTASHSNLSGSALVIVIKTNNNAGSEYLRFDDVIVTGTASGSVDDPSSLSASVQSSSQINLTWTDNSSSDNVLLAWNSTSTFGTPTDGSTYSADASISGGGTVLQYSSTDSYSHTSLSGNTAYYYKAWSYDGSSYSSGATGDGTTLKVEPTNHPTNFSVTSTYQNITLSWTDAVTGSQAPDGYLILGETDASIDNPEDGTAVSDDTDESDNTLAKNVTHGSGASYTFSDLAASTTYYFEIFSYTNSGSNIDYYTGGTIVTGNATTGTAPSVVINEIHYNPATSQGNDNAYEFLELYNYGTSDVDISGWSFTNDNHPFEYTIPNSTTLSAGAYLIIAVNSSNYAGSVQWTSGGLSNSGEQITLIDGSSNVIDDLTYDDNSAWGSNADGGGSSLELIIATANNSLSGSWSASSTTNGTPGTANSVHGAVISGTSGFRFFSTPVSNGTYSDLLDELWTQCMANSDGGGDDGDDCVDNDNVWSFALVNGNVGTYTALSDLGGTMTAGAGFLVYVFADTDWDGTADLPVTLSVSGTENSGDVRYPTGSDNISVGQYGLAGNPYASTIDWDGIKDDDTDSPNISNVVYVYDYSGSSASGIDVDEDQERVGGIYRAYNGSAGSLTGGLIAPYQGFWVQASGGSGYITIKESHKSSSSGTFYRITDDESVGSMVFNFTSGNNYFDQAYLTFHGNGDQNIDNADAYKLMPLNASGRLIGLTYVMESAIYINNLSYEYEGAISVPFDVMRLTLDETNYITVAEEVTLTWDLEELPDHIELILTDNITSTETILDQESEYVFTTEPKGSFSASYDGPIGTYPVVGEPRFTLSVTYGALGQNEDATLPSDFALHPVYPNPFNPSATISFDIPKVSGVELSVYDVKGALVETLLQENMKPGKHHYNWEPQVLSSGVYFMKLTTANKSFTQKVTYIK